MDYFSSIPQQGLVDCLIRTTFTPSKKLSLDLDYHFFRLAEGRYDSQSFNNQLNKNLGSEIDLKIIYNIFKDIKIDAGYSYFFTTNTLNQIKGIEFTNEKPPMFVYLMVMVNQKVFL